MKAQPDGCIISPVCLFFTFFTLSRFLFSHGHLAHPVCVPSSPYTDTSSVAKTKSTQRHRIVLLQREQAIQCRAVVLDTQITTYARPQLCRTQIIRYYKGIWLWIGGMFASSPAVKIYVFAQSTCFTLAYCDRLALSESVEKI